jgi:hypothetical protein
MISQTKTVRFLDPSDERFMLAVPLVGFVLMFACWGLGHFSSGFSVNMELTRLIVALIFLDSIHVVYTLILLLALPEMRAWATREIVSSTGKRMMGFWPKVALIITVLTAGFYFLSIAAPTKNLSWVMAAFILIEVIGPNQHIVAQLRGISFCYNSTIRSQRKFTPEEMTKASLAEKRERWLMRLLLFSHLAYWVPRTLSSAKFYLPGSELLRHVGLVGLLILSVAILVNAWTFPKQGESKKFLFLTRVFIYPLKALTLSASVLSRAVHGTEYLAIFRKMVKSSSMTDAQKTGTFGIAWAVTLLYGLTAILAAPRLLHLFTHWSEPRFLFSGLILFHLVTRYVHYYMDRAIYRMSDPATRKLIGPLLQHKASPEPLGVPQFESLREAS